MIIWLNLVNGGVQSRNLLLACKFVIPVRGRALDRNVVSLLLVRILSKLLLTVPEVAIVQRPLLPVYLAPHILELSLGLVLASDGIFRLILQRLKLVSKRVLLLHHLVFELLELRLKVGLQGLADVFDNALLVKLLLLMQSWHTSRPKVITLLWASIRGHLWRGHHLREAIRARLLREVAHHGLAWLREWRLELGVVFGRWERIGNGMQLEWLAPWWRGSRLETWLKLWISNWSALYQRG